MDIDVPAKRLWSRSRGEWDSVVGWGVSDIRDDAGGDGKRQSAPGESRQRCRRQHELAVAAPFVILNHASHKDINAAVFIDSRQINDSDILIFDHRHQIDDVV